MKYRLIIRGDFLHKIQDYLYPAENYSLERFAVVFLSPSRSRGMRTLIPSELWLPREEDYQRQSQTGLKLTDGFVNLYYQHCADYGYSLMTIHSHPFDECDSNFFSNIDDHSDFNQFDFFRLLVPNGFFVAGVVNRKKIFTARVFDAQVPGSQGLLFNEALYCDFPLKKEFPLAREKKDFSLPDGIYDRQVRAFGREGQVLMESMQVCIVGVGGLGAVLTEVLARLGVRNFTLIDHDTAEWTNLNRFTGMYQSDVDKKRHKVKIARRLIRKINRSAQVRCIETKVYSKRAVNSMKQADIIFLCTDNATSRDFVNKFCVQYLTTCISLGSVITYSKKIKRITSILGEVIVMIPGSTQEKFCLICSGAINTDLLKLENAPGNLTERIYGYIHGAEEPAPAVRYLNGLVANLAASEFHNLVCNFKRPVFYQQINLMPKIRTYDDFFIEDFENFLQYLLDEKIILRVNEALRESIIKHFTIYDESEGRYRCSQRISDDMLANVTNHFAKNGIIPSDRKDAFSDEIMAYFAVESRAEEPLIASVDVRQDEDNCPVCGAKGLIMGQGDLTELKKFTY
jgi:molybdopterin-synthase adenylyltransferase